LEGTKEGGLPIHTTLVTALVLPLLAGGVWWMVRHVKHQSQ